MKFIGALIFGLFAAPVLAADATVTLTIPELQALVDSEISQDHLRQAQAAASAAQAKAKSAYDKYNAAVKPPEPDKK